MKKHVYILAAVLSVAACTKNTADVPSTDGLTPVTFRGGIPLTKTSFGTEEDETVSVLWGKVDKIGVYLTKDGNPVEGGINRVGRIVSGTETGPGYNVANFTVSLPLEGSVAYVANLYYPYRAEGYAIENGTPSVIDHRVPGVQVQSGANTSGHLGNNGAFSFASVSFNTPAEVSSYTPELGFTLHHKTAYIRLDVSAADGGFYGWKVSSVKVSAPSDVALAGTVQYVPETDSFDVISDATSSVLMTIGGGLALSNTNPGSIWIVTVPADLSGKSLSFTYTLTNGDQERRVVHTRSFGADTHALEAGATHAFTEAIPSSASGDWAYFTDEVDLSAGGTSNCYIAWGAGDYSFDATVIGNGQKGIITPISDSHFHTDDASINPSSAELLWQSAPGLITAVNFAGGRITFTKASGHGNAVIAALDASGNVLWSWHIWCTQLGEAQANINSYNRFMMMDRNLGATYGSTELVTDETLQDRTVGLFYQWGRKDPFPGGAKLVKNSAEAACYDIDGNVTARPAPVLKSATTGTVSYTIANPRVFVYASNNNYDWFYSPAGEAVAGPANHGFGFWGDLYGNNYGGNNPTTPMKTIYDPCPEGWVIPQEDVWGGSVTFDSKLAGKGVLLKYEGGTSWYPLTNIISATTGQLGASNIGSYAYVWSSGWNGDSSTRPWKMQITASSNSKTNTTSYGNSYGFSVRCCQEY